MNKVKIKAWNGKRKFSLNDIKDLVKQGELFRWYLVEIDGYGLPPGGESMPSYQERITQRTKIVWQNWNEVEQMCDWVEDLNWFWLIAYETEEIKLDSFEGTLEFADFVFQAKVHDSTWVDISFNNIEAIHESVLNNLVQEFGNYS